MEFLLNAASIREPVAAARQASWCEHPPRGSPWAGQSVETGGAFTERTLRRHPHSPAWERELLELHGCLQMQENKPILSVVWEVWRTSQVSTA